MRLLTEVISILRARDVPHALIGAGAMAVHGVTPSTYGMEVLVVDPSVLDERVWEAVRHDGSVDVRRGETVDPLAGFVRFERPHARSLDLIVGRLDWQRRAIERAVRESFVDLELPVVSAADLILLKLHAGGPQDARDIEQLLAEGDRAALISEVNRHVSELPSDSVALWQRIVSS